MYVPAFISAAGLVVPSYADIQADLIAGYLAIYPAVTYLGTETAKYQEISLFALKTADVYAAIQLDYNARAISTAVGSALDALGSNIGTARKGSTFSTAPELITGVAFTIITNGTVTDTAGNVWTLPTTVTIPSGGSVVVPVTCQTPGAIQAAAGAINRISGGATGGWTGATNPSDASPGLPVEADSQYRGRLFLSVALPSLTRLASTIARVAAVPGVTRYNPHENDTGGTDAAGTPAHSISFVVEGGTDLDVATAIFGPKGIGAFTNPGSSGGSVTVPVTDPTTGITQDIGFQRPDPVDIWVVMTVHGLTGYTTEVLALIKAAIVLYLNSLQIGETLTYSSLYAVAQSVMPSLILPQFSIRSYTLGTAPSPVGTSDIVTDYNQVVRGNAANVSITAV